MARFLIVDDEPALRELVRDILAMEGHAADLAADGLEALAQVKKAAYDMMLIDRNMPRMSGVEVVRTIRSEPRFNALKILMITASTVTKDIDEAFAAGADGYIAKPIEIKPFLDKISAALKK